MMDSGNQSFEEDQLYTAREEMETLTLHDSFDDKSFSGYRTAASSLSDTHHPLAAPPIHMTSAADSDPLLSPPSPNRNSNLDTISINSTSTSNNNNNNNSSSYIEPPSYADVVFSPFDERAVNEINGLDSPSHSESSNSLSRSPSLASDSIRITVSNPQKEQETSNSLVPGGNTYVTYLITTRTNIPPFNGTEFSVRRRFRDVVTLSDRLAESYRGLFIPPRPDKSVVESQVMQKQEFVEQRRISLEKYLMSLASHPVIKKSDELRVFLEAQGKLPLPTSTDVASRMLDGAVNLPRQLFGGGESVMVAPSEVVQPAKGGRDLLRLFKELKQSMANDWGGVKPAVVEEDKEFLESKERMQDLEQQLSNASQQAESLVKAQQDMGDTLGELGLTFIKLTKLEGEKPVFNCQRERAAIMKNFATAAVKASRFYRDLNNNTVKHLDMLHKYLSLMLSVHGAFSDRASALLTVQTLLSELATLHSRAEKLEAASSKIFGGDKSRVHKIEELKDTIRATEDAKSVAIREYERIKENNRTELERLDRERHADFANMLKGFVFNQVGFAEKIADVWSKIADETSGYAKGST